MVWYFADSAELGAMRRYHAVGVGWATSRVAKLERGTWVRVMRLLAH